MNGMLPLSELDHAELYNMRMRPGASQGMLAPYEHRAFAREWSKESPVAAGLSLPFAIPAYQLAKLLGLQQARTPASLDELFAGYHGYAEGMLDRLVPSAQAGTRESLVDPRLEDRGSLRRVNAEKPPVPPKPRKRGDTGGVRG